MRSIQDEANIALRHEKYAQRRLAALNASSDPAMRELYFRNIQRLGVQQAQLRDRAVAAGRPNPLNVLPPNALTRGITPPPGMAFNATPKLPHPDASNQAVGPNLGGPDAVSDSLPPGTGAGMSGGGAGLLLLAGAVVVFLLLRKK